MFTILILIMITIKNLAMPAMLMAAEASPWTALAASKQVNEPDIENTEQNYDYGYD